MFSMIACQEYSEMRPQLSAKEEEVYTHIIQALVTQTE